MSELQMFSPLFLPSVTWENRRSLPSESGVYFALSKNCEVLYVGATADLKARWRGHHRENDLRAMECASIAYYLCPKQDLSETEQSMITHLSPKLNPHGGHPYIDRRHKALGITRSIVFPRQLYTKLELLAGFQERTVSSLIVDAVRRTVADHQKTVDMLTKKTDREE